VISQSLPDSVISEPLPDSEISELRSRVKQLEEELEKEKQDKVLKLKQFEEELELERQSKKLSHPDGSRVKQLEDELEAERQSRRLNDLQQEVEAELTPKKARLIEEKADLMTPYTKAGGDSEVRDNMSRAFLEAEKIRVTLEDSSKALEASKNENNELQEKIEKLRQEHEKALKEIKSLSAALQKEKENVTPPSEAPSDKSTTSVITLRTLLERNRKLEDDMKNTLERSGELVTKMCEAQNQVMEREREILKLRVDNRDLRSKNESMETLTEQASSVKIALAKRLEQLILENRQLRAENRN